VQPFDFERILFGDAPIHFLLEIVFRTAVLYLYTLGTLRLIGQRGMEKLSSFDFAIVIAMGSAVGDPMFYPNVPLLHGMAVITTILAVERGLAWVTKKSKTAETIIEGVTSDMIVAGRINRRHMRHSMLSHGELFMKLRENNIRHLGEVEAAYLEMDGSYSVFTYPQGKARPGLPIVPPWDIVPPQRYAPGDLVPDDGVYACADCGEISDFKQGERFSACQNCGEENSWVRAVMPEQESNSK
jgi:uncharacterized membrane protein YcaP (DUF421 family)